MIGARVLLAWPVLIAQLIIFGTAAFALSLGSRPSGGRVLLIARLRRLWRGLAAAAGVFSPLLFVQIASGMAQMDWRAVVPMIPAVLDETHAGHVWEWRLPIVALTIVASWLPLNEVLVAALLVAASAALLVCESLTSHAIDRGAAAVLIYVVHEMAAALWIGAILGLWIGARRARLSDAWIQVTASWVSRIAEWTVAALLLSGLYTAYYSLMGDASMLIYAAYGRVLLIKAGAAAIVLMIGAYNRLFLIPQIDGPSAQAALLGNVAAESVLLLGVIGIAAVLANTPPTHA